MGTGPPKNKGGQLAVAAEQHLAARSVALASGVLLKLNGHSEESPL